MQEAGQHGIRSRMTKRGTRGDYAGGGESFASRPSIGVVLKERPMTKRNTGIKAFASRLHEAGVFDPSGADGGDRYLDDRSGMEAPSLADSDIGCSIKPLPVRLQYRAAEVAALVNPTNAPVVGLTSAVKDGVLPTPLAAAVVTSKYWGPTPRMLTVSFVDNPQPDLRRRILSHMNAWTQTGCIEFVETAGTGQVRISRGAGGYWSYLGTDVLLIPEGRPTMNLQGFSMNTPESEYKRVVRHETGHTLGMPHEHMRRDLVARIDREKAYEYFLRTQGWDRRTVDQQVLTPLDEATLMFTPADQDSIMCYQLPGSITKDGQPIRGGLDINATDFGFVARIYPRAASNEPRHEHGEDWPASDDVAAIAV
jgi:hypothetical protein